MAAGYGFAGHIGFAKESSGGTAVAATNYIEALSESLTPTFDRFDTKNIVGRFAEPDDEQGVKRISGDLAFAVNPEDVPFFLLGAMGVQSNTVVASGVLHTHEFTMRTADFDDRFPQDPFTFEIFRDVTSAQQYAGAQISALEFNVAPNQDLRATATLMALSETNIEKTTASFTGSPVSPMAFDTCSISIGGAASALIEALTVRIDSQLEGVPTLNNSTNVRKFRRTGFQQIRISGDIAFEDITEYENFKNETEQEFKVNLTRANSFSMLIDMPRVIYTAFPLGIAGRDRQVVSFEGVARFHTGSNQAIQIDVTNTTSGY